VMYEVAGVRGTILHEGSLVGSFFALSQSRHCLSLSVDLWAVQVMDNGNRTISTRGEMKILYLKIVMAAQWKQAYKRKVSFALIVIQGKR